MNKLITDISMKLRPFACFILFTAILFPFHGFSEKPGGKRPNVILIMADDLGWGDVSFNGNVVIKTPELDKMAANGLQFTRFYAAAPVCSPTRGSVLTGRHPERYGITFANEGFLKKQELTIAEVLKANGYATGHFGKWHLGTFSETIKDGRRGGSKNGLYSPPWENGFDTCFSTEQAVPTWNPATDQPFETKYWTGPGQFARENLDGDASRVILDRAIPFIDKAVKKDQPFLAVLWLHAPHSPVVAGKAYLDKYKDLPSDKQHYYGCISAMDEQIGRPRQELRRLKIADNTIIFFTSDNGPAGKGGGTLQEPGERQQGSAGQFRGRKGSLYEGGIRVPALVEWPAKIKVHKKIHTPLNTTDYYPTILDLLGIKTGSNQLLPLDGVSFKRILNDNPEAEQVPERNIAFHSLKQRALMDNRYKIYSPDSGATYELFDLQDDPYETKNIAADQPEKVSGMSAWLTAWIAGCEKSNAEIR